MRRPERVYVLDTNALLHQPTVVQELPGAEVVIPQTVLLELDKLKTSRTDKHLLYNAREVSRILFGFSRFSSLADGVELDNGALVRVAEVNPDRPIPEILRTKTSDDRIIALAYQLGQETPRRPVTLLTSDLNMLVKAQTHRIAVQALRERQTPWHRAWAGVARNQRQIQVIFSVGILLVFAALLMGIWLSVRQQYPVPTPQASSSRTSTAAAREKDYLRLLAENPRDPGTLVALADLYFAQGKYQLATARYQQALDIDPSNATVRTGLAVAFFHLGRTDDAVRQLQRGLVDNPNIPNAYYYLGLILWRDRSDIAGARHAFRDYLQVAPSGPHASDVRRYLKELEQ